MTRTRNVAIVGIGQTPHRAHRQDVNQVEMVNEAIRAALEDAKLDLKDVDAVVHGNMELFEGNFQGDMWHATGDGAYLKSGLRITTGGTTGGTLVCAGDHLVASGIFDIVLLIGWEKQEEGHTTTGITGMADPLWGRKLQTGAIGALRAARMMREYGQRAELAAAKLRVQIGENASRNPYAHLRTKVTIEDVLNSPLLVYPLRLLHMCPQSNGACALLLACEEEAKNITQKPVWIKDHVTVHRENFMAPSEVIVNEDRGEMSTMELAARRLYQRNGILNPLKEIDVFEMYDPHVWMHIEWMEKFLLLRKGENISMIENGATAIDGVFPINPSGGVVATNPIGATAMIRVAEVALQIRGDAGEYQIPREVNIGMASSFGGTGWTILHLLSKHLN